MSEQESLTSKASDNVEKVNASPQPSADAVKPIPENSIIGSSDESDTLIEMSGPDSKEDQENPEKTSEDDSSDQTNIKKSRELKSLLALSKEANLDTNISRKRKVVEGHKTPLLKNTSPDSDIKIIKVATENKHNFKYPVTAEAELEEELTKNETNFPSDNTNKLKRKRDNLSDVSLGGATATEDSKKNRKTFAGDLKMFKANKDAFCWRCHRNGVNVACETCPRSYHQKCLKQTINNPDHWPCPECVAILKAENTQTRSEAMKGMPLEYLCKLLKFAVNRMIQCQGSEPFLHPVNDIEFPEYKKYIIQPMDLTMLLNNIKENFYGSTQAFEADAKWLLHNSIIFNSYQSKLTYSAKSIIKVCKQEMTEIENCPNCYMNANTKRATWFVEVCPKPHLLVWAKLKGFPYWPAKAMTINSGGMVDVRFFGAHDRAWVHYKECFLYSEKDPNTFKQKRYDIEKCVKELDIYIQNLRKTYGEFKYAPYRMPLDPDNLAKQLHIFLPKYKQLMARRKSFKGTIENIAEPDSIKEEPTVEEGRFSESNKIESSSEEKENKCIVGDSFEKELSEQSNDLKGSYSNVNSPENDNDVTMEGYGTDDDSVVEIDLERRKAFAGQNIQKMEEDEDDDNDTQVPSNISIEGTPFKDNIRTPGGLSNSGKLKISRKKSEIDNSKKRISTEEVYSQLKLSRRNSDQSVKSDSSRLSNISDKISRVDISENMEITLGNDDIGCVSISENISPPNGESSRSNSDYSVENKRKPVQVDIDNAEFSISPSNKVKISDQLIKRLSDAGEKIEGVKKSLVETKSQTDILIEKFQGVVQHEVVDFSQPGTSSNDNQEKDMSPKNTENNSVEDISKLVENQTDSGSDTLKVYEKEKTASPSKCIQTTKTANEIYGENPQNPNYFNKDLITSMSSGIIESNISSERNTENKIPTQKDYAVKRASDEIIKKQKMIQPSITEFTSVISAKDNKSVTDKSSDESSDEVLEKKKSDEEKVSSEMVNIVDEFQQETEALDPVQIDKKKIFNIIHSSLNQAQRPKNVAAKVLVPTDKPISRESKSVDKSPEKILQKLENMVGSFKKDVLKSMDSSANNTNNSENLFSPVQKKKSEDKQVIKERQAGNKTSIMASSKKRKNSSADQSSKSKIVKLVPIESILNKTKEEKGSSNDTPVEKPAKGKVVIRKVPVSNVSSSSSSFTVTNSISSIISVHETNQEEIKSEPDSDDDFSESENLEAKRKYLSALNISEKQSDFDKNSSNEIRTRAKAEEKREKCKIVDNLTRIIDDVALNYSAEYDGDKMSARMQETRPSCSGIPPHEGEIFVKSFAKLQTANTGNGKQRARKSFPMPCYASPVDKPKSSASKKDISVHMPKKDLPVHMPKKDNLKGHSTKREVSKATSSHPSRSTFAKTHPPTNSANPPESTASAKTLHNLSNVVISEGKTIASAGVGVTQASVGIIQTAGVGVTQASVGIIQTSKPADTSGSTPTHFYLLPTSGLNYCVPLANTTMNSVPSVPSTSTVTTLQPQPAQQSLLRSSIVPLNLRASQNYIPQGDESNETVPGKSPPTNNQLLNDLLSQPLGNSTRNSEQSTTARSNNGNGSSSSNTGAVTETQQEDEFAILNSILPDNVSKAVSDLLMRPPPKLKPRPPGVLNQVFDEGPPSSAGAVSTRINSIAHRMGDYFRGMLVETLEDLGKCANPEAKIIGLQLELETQKYRHILEMTELRKNVCITLKDIQRSILEEREKVIDETRAACEAEAIKRVELAKSKQWCANCSKEAQFYCCWNTSYCDYPCQQKHWPQHMGKCTQSIEKTNTTTSLPNRPSPQIVLRPAGPPKSGVGRIVAKPTKVYPRATAPIKSYKSISATNNHITVIETTPGSFELVGNGPIAVSGKMYTSSSTKLKPTNTTSNIPSTSYTLAPAGMGSAPRPSPSTSTTLRSPPARLPFSIPAANMMDDN